TGARGELRAGRVVGCDRFELARVDLGEARLGARDLCEALELLPDLLVGEVFVEELRHGLERGAVVLELLLVERGEAAEQVAPLAGVVARGEPRLERKLALRPVRAATGHGL